MSGTCPRILIAGLAGDSGKTLVSLALLTALRQRGMRPTPFKKGPDYIDAAWLGWAAETVCRNLDSFMVDRDTLTRRFVSAGEASEFAVIEGNRGLFDGQDVQGSHASAALACQLAAPVVLVVDATKATRTLAALVKGCMVFEPGVSIGGVILNRVAGTRHEQLIRDAIETYCELPVFGALPKPGAHGALIPPRHLGLTPPTELDGCDSIRESLGELARDYLDVDALIRLATTAEPIESQVPAISVASGTTAKIGYFRDSVFTFYYPENLEALRSAGATLIPVSAMSDRVMPSLDGLYIGGGFPETQVERLTSNRTLMNQVAAAVDRGLPVYAECGGLIYLSRSLHCEAGTHSMAGVFDIDLELRTRPCGHGYVTATADTDNPFHSRGTIIHGHEFHYTAPTETRLRTSTCLQVSKGVGVGGHRDGLLKKNCLATYVHLHADGVPDWAPSFVRAAAAYRTSRATSVCA